MANKKHSTHRQMRGQTYAQEMQKRREARDRIITMWATQLTLDVMAGLLNDCYGFGAERLTKISEEFNARWPEYMQAISKNPESDYIRDRIDRQQEQIFGPEYLRWEERYEHWS